MSYNAQYARAVAVRLLVLTIPFLLLVALQVMAEKLGALVDWLAEALPQVPEKPLTPAQLAELDADI